MKEKILFLGLMAIVLVGSVTLYSLQKSEWNILMAHVSELEKMVAESPSVPRTETKYIEESSVIDTVENAKHSVVSIVQTQTLRVLRRKESPYYDPFFHPFVRPEYEEELKEIQVGGGSGFIYSNNGLVLTNRHVVESEDAEYTVVMHDGTEYEAKVLARDTYHDVAVLQIQGNDLPHFPPLELGTSEDIRVGQRVVAIGNALAEFENTVTTGIISGLNRDLLAGAGEGEIRNLIQTDAAINPGNSGGPLLTLDGKVIGINTAIISGAEGIGFAIPSEDVKSIAKSVAESGRIIRPFLGIRYIPLHEDISEELGLSISEGALIFGNSFSDTSGIVPNSPAEQAGIKEGDIITKIDGIPLTKEESLADIISQKIPGETISLEIYRGGKVFHSKVELGEIE